MKHIGIAGITVPGAVLCINTIVEESYKRLGKGIHPQITYTQPNFNEIEKPQEKRDWNKVADNLLDSIERLHKSGADFAIIPSNSPHFAIEKVQAKSPIPIISIVEITVNECKKRGFKKTGILGVKTTMKYGLYIKPLKKLGIEPINLSSTKQKQISDLIYDEIIKGKPTRKTTEKMQKFIQDLKEMGADSFIAGCTEIPVVITSEKDSPLPFVDTTRLLAKKALEYALG